jgi:hypothetical protein
MLSVSFPEPALPQRWRGLSLEDALPRLPELLAERMWVAPHPASPFRMRKLTAVQASGAATPLEAAVTLARFAGQLRLPAEVVLAGPPGAAADVTPTRFDHPLVRIAVDDALWWIDPLCPSCPAGSVPPSLVGAPIYGGGTVAQGSNGSP